MSDQQHAGQDWVFVIDPNHILRAQRDQVRTKEAGQWSEWRHPPYGEGLTIAQYFAGPGEWECRTPRESMSQQPPDPDQHTEQPGSKYKRLLHQTLPEGQAGAFVVVDVYDILRAWDVRDPAIQHAIKKLLQPGQRGSKSAVQDLREAIGSIERAIQLLGDG